MPLFSGRCYSAAKLVGRTAIITGCNTGIGKETVLDFYKRGHSDAKLVGRTAIITGYNTVVGKETVLDFYKRGAKVIMACRNLEKAEEAKVDIEKSCKDIPETGHIVLAKCDLSSMKSIREFAQNILDNEPQINILVNNAGVMMCPLMRTEDDFEMQFGTNHLGHFLLTMLLLPRIKKSTPARIVTVSSRAHSRSTMHFDDLNYKNITYKAGDAYCQSKLANVLFSRELSKKLQENNIEGINTYSLHPGVIKTELGRHMDQILFRGARSLIGFVVGPFMKTPELGAQTTIYCSVDEKCANESGLYYSDCAVISPSQKSLNDEYAKKLWTASCELVGLDYDPFTAADPGLKKP